MKIYKLVLKKEFTPTEHSSVWSHVNPPLEIDNFNQLPLIDRTLEKAKNLTVQYPHYEIQEEEKD